MNGENVKNVSFPKNLHLVMGNEANGITKEISQLISKKVKIASIIPNDLPEKIKTATYNKKPKWKSAKGKTGDSSRAIKKTSFGLLQSEDNNESDSVSLVSSGLRMLTTLSLVLGLIFLLFFGF